MRMWVHSKSTILDLITCLKGSLAVQITKHGVRLELGCILSSSPQILDLMLLFFGHPPPQSCSSLGLSSFSFLLQNYKSFSISVKLLLQVKANLKCLLFFFTCNRIRSKIFQVFISRYWIEIISYFRT